jgi:hypothetical protein
MGSAIIRPTVETPSTIPRALADLVIDRVAKASATGIIESPAADTACPNHRSLKLRSARGDRDAGRFTDRFSKKQARH